MKTENTNNENAKTENAKPRRVKMKFQVSEFHHLFLNRRLPDQATAGEHARYNAGILYHAAGSPAAAFLDDVRAPNGDPVLAIMPPPQDGCRWAPRVIAAAVPPGVHVIRLDYWPCGNQRYGSDARNLRTQRRAASAADTLAVLTYSINALCERAAHSAKDADGSDPLIMPHLVNYARDLLALAWNDQAAQERARNDLQTCLDTWQTGPRGEYDRETIRAISQRRHIEKDAAENLPKLRAYFDQRAAMIQARRSLKDRAKYAQENARDLRGAIAAVLRAGLPPAALHGIPVNIAGTINADLAAAERAAVYVNAPRAIAHAWARVIRGDTARIDMPEKAPKWARLAAEEINNFRSRKIQREQAKSEIERAQRRRATLRAEWWTILEPLFLENENTGGIAWNADKVTEAASLAETEKAVNFAEYLARANGAYCNGKNPDLAWPGDLPDPVAVLHAAITVKENRAEYVRANRWRMEADNKRGEMAARIQADTNTRPRALIAYLEGAARAVDGGWSWREMPGDLRAALLDEIKAALENARPALESISALQEYENGGEIPGPGDWLIVDGKQARTNRGARVSTRAILAAFAFIDQQAPGVFNCRDQNMMIGDFQLIGRDENGAIIVGCHTFTAAAVDHIRDQVTRAAIAQENAA